MKDVDGKPRGTPRNCKCGAAEVPWGDHVQRQGRLLNVHGLLLCYSMERQP